MVHDAGAALVGNADAADGLVDDVIVADLAFGIVQANAPLVARNRVESDQIICRERRKCRCRVGVVFEVDRPRCVRIHFAAGDQIVADGAVASPPELNAAVSGSDNLVVFDENFVSPTDGNPVETKLAAFGGFDMKISNGDLCQSAVLVGGCGQNAAVVAPDA